MIWKHLVETLAILQTADLPVQMAITSCPEHEETDTKGNQTPDRATKMLHEEQLTGTCDTLFAFLFAQISPHRWNGEPA